MIVTVVWATSDVQDVVPVEVDAVATLGDAVNASGLLDQYKLDAHSVRYALYGKRAEGDTRLASGDRIEILGPLVVDPQVARARRARSKQTPSSSKSSNRGLK